MTADEDGAYKWEFLRCEPIHKPKMLSLAKLMPTFFLHFLLHKSKKDVCTFTLVKVEYMQRVNGELWNIVNRVQQ